MFNSSIHCQYCYNLLGRVFDHETSDCRRSRTSHSQFTHPNLHFTWSASSILRLLPTAHTDPNADVAALSIAVPTKAYISHTEATTPAVMIATVAEATTEDAVTLRQEHVFS